MFIIENIQNDNSLWRLINSNVNQKEISMIYTVIHMWEDHIMIQSCWWEFKMFGKKKTFISLQLYSTILHSTLKMILMLIMNKLKPFTCATIQRREKEGEKIVMYIICVGKKHWYIFMYVEKANQDFQGNYTN